MAFRIEKDFVTSAGLRAVVIVCQFEEGVDRHRCGYVGVDAGSKLWNKDYSEQLDCIDQEAVDTAQVGEKGVITIFTAGARSDGESKVRRSLDIAIDCHGGLTYAGGGIGSIYPVESELWWFGFDCAHYGDATITQRAFEIEHGFENEGIVRSLLFCELQCEKIAVQLVALEQGITLSTPEE